MKGITMMKTLFLFIFIFINTHVMSNMDKYIDFDIIESYKKPITMPAKYLEVFSVVYKDFSSFKSNQIESYIVNISESKDLYIIKFSIPRKQLVLGGGSGFYHIDKHTMKIIKVEFYK
ncbi:hypothetical protein [uncultured Gammaproteobacteria bacterium]|jgi:hypothetical protein|uniref:hypothetical protein n=1 Tax=thiotrophic endosymbiont of Bathymodiolus puteoserpentis (Logatchev) TaxID=343240 RepID=UPI0010B9F574|nr:hypothetical protein [thiotrophic endosymbiont of Bathymodiolus puteoserpentis (Logatchev)]CAC9485927.1 hypothetical protein [uncultured Gammaproteobacteria bacterium]CAC9650459.1 hypothetical protein [uncultured Gammaproteobacteria bacterium]CAC9982396.1 hypothetical protein [uncultured Gammaproteobacteria bacterium]SSC11447.1 hypothetical protein BPUTEOSOX_1895 [thiotrophic endosymbiont of Bathymodiolus puteoserpentis (Logatchev)]